MENIRRAYVEIHIAVFIFGFAAILGALISVSAATLIFWRSIIAVLSFLSFKEIHKDLKSISFSNALIYVGIGGVICLHWLCFYGSVKLANASVALIAFSSMSIFTAFVEPIFLKSKIQFIDIVFGLAIIPAMALTVNSLDFSMHMGAFVGILSALFGAIFSVLNKKYISRIGPVTITFLNMVGVLLTISILLPFIVNIMNIQLYPSNMDWIYIVLLALGCTTLGFILMTRSFRYISAFSTNFVLNLEPVYGVIFAILILREHKDLNLQFYLGVIILTLLVFIYPLIKRRAWELK